MLRSWLFINLTLFLFFAHDTGRHQKEKKLPPSLHPSFSAYLTNSCTRHVTSERQSFKYWPVAEIASDSRL